MLRPSYNLRNTSAPVPVRRKLVSPRQTFVMAPPHALPATGAGYGDRAVLTGISWVFTLFLLVRLVLTDPVMNGFINYSDEGGSLIEKIHPATYGIIGLLVLTLFRVQVTLRIAEFRLIKTMLGLIGVIFGLTIFLTMIGRSVSMGYLLETYIGACLAAFNRDWSRRVLAQGARVLLVSDGLDRDNAAGLALATERLHKSCRELIWLNPLLRYSGFEARAAASP